MCGIVGVAGNLLALDKEIFTELLHTDVVRGKHATGMIQVKGQCRSVDNFKLAYAAPLFLDLGVVQDKLKGFISNTVAVGHNRHATKGASDAHENAHPFNHGNISMVHNGSLTSWALLTPTGETYAVDSEAICRALQVDGAEVVIPKLRGAFTLVWVDTELNTLNFVRNEERPMCIAMNTTVNKMWWASERGMLEWSLNRNVFSRKPAIYDEIFELPVGEWLQIPITSTGVDLAGRVTTAIDVSNSVYVPNYSYGRATWDPKRGRLLTPGEKLLSVEEREATKDATAKALENKPVGSQSTSPSILEARAVTKVPGETVTQFSFGPSREDAMKKITSNLICSKGRESVMFREFVGTIDTDPDAAILDERIGMFVTDYEPYEANPGFGTMKGYMIEHPFCQVAVHNLTNKEYEDCVNKAIAMVTSYLIGIVIPDGASPLNLDNDQLAKFTVVLRRDQIRRAKLDDFEWHMDKMPSATPQPSGLSDSRVVVLKDDSQVSTGGTAVFLGATDEHIVSNLRYSVESIDMEGKIMMLTVKIGSKLISHPWGLWGQGTNSSAASLVKPKADQLVVGPNHEHIPYKKWLDMVDEGCKDCSEPMNDPEKADDLLWITDDQYICGPCYFLTANRAYL